MYGQVFRQRWSDVGIKVELSSSFLCPFKFGESENLLRVFNCGMQPCQLGPGVRIWDPGILFLVFWCFLNIPEGLVGIWAPSRSSGSLRRQLLFLQTHTRCSPSCTWDSNSGNADNAGDLGWGFLRSAKGGCWGVVWFRVGILLCESCEPLVRRLQRLEEEVLELPQLGHVRLHEGPALVHRPPGHQPPQLKAESSDQPSWFSGKSCVLEVLSNCNHVSSIENHCNHRTSLSQGAKKSFNCRPNIHLWKRDGYTTKWCTKMCTHTAKNAWLLLYLFLVIYEINLMGDELENLRNPDPQGCWLR